MSILRNRIITQAGTGRAAQASVHPAGTAATPMEMPLALVTYNGYMALYGTLQPLITADGAVIAGTPEGMISTPVPAPVVPAGRA